jgi:hypothetical protein
MTTEKVGTTNLVTAAAFQSQQVAVEILKTYRLMQWVLVGRNSQTTTMAPRMPYEAAVNVGKGILPYIVLCQAFFWLPSHLLSAPSARFLAVEPKVEVSDELFFVHIRQSHLQTIVIRRVGTYSTFSSILVNSGHTVVAYCLDIACL